MNARPHYIFIVIILVLVIWMLTKIQYTVKETDTLPDEVAGETGSVEGDTPVIKMKNVYVYPGIFEGAFQKGTQVIQDAQTYSFYTQTIGKITIESGKLVACDPIVLQDVEPYVYDFPKGKFPVQLGLVNYQEYPRVSFARILFSQKPVVTWRLALHGGQEPLEVGSENIYCFGVDAASGIFADYQTCKTFMKFHEDEWEETFMGNTDFRTGFMREFDWGNFAIFSTGYGDGCYATYVGFDDQGEICRFLADFATVSWWLLPNPRLQPSVADTL
ncbi:MAG TPA: DUF4241 domain-containing protein [Flavobacteriales bacterium]|nr:DUF4241 domain-containing protein [Flavobacteriales bacterium]